MRRKIRNFHCAGAHFVQFSMILCTLDRSRRNPHYPVPIVFVIPELCSQDVACFVYCRLETVSAFEKKRIKHRFAEESAATAQIKVPTP